MNSRRKRFQSAFCHSGALCSTDCDCGRVHFVSGSNHGDYEPGELDELLCKSSSEPDRYISHCDTISIADCFGHRFVLGCPCGLDDRVAIAIEQNAHDVAQYIRLWITDRRAERRSDEWADMVAVDHMVGLESELETTEQP